MMIALTWLTSIAAFPAMYLPPFIHGIMGHGEPGWKLSWSLNYINVQVWGAIGLFLLVYLAMGPSRRETLKKSLRIPPMIYFGLGILLPTIVSALLPMLQYTFARIQWAAYDFHRFEPPVFSSYFEDSPSWPYLFLVLGALVEEIGWRGYLQPRLISRYGLYRGIFLLGIVWSVFHLPSDFSWRMSLSHILLHSLERFLDCLSWGFALSWLTLRSKSVLPAALMHGVSNIFIFSGWNDTTPVWIMISLWVMIDVVLFRYFPPKVDDAASGLQESTPQDPPQHLQQILDLPS